MSNPAEITTFWRLLERIPVRIPGDRRGYVQGRPDAARVLGDFADALCAALRGDGRLELDCVIGSIRDGAFEPLDGRQRLTALFLLHWRVAAGEERLDDAVVARLRRFSDRTRPDVRRFCRFLAGCRPSFASLSGDSLSAAILELGGDPAWEEDESVAGMLAMLDALHVRLAADAAPRWPALAAPPDIAPVTFPLLEDARFGAARLYVGINSRGRNLAAFETIRAWLAGFLEKRAEGAPAGSFWGHARAILEEHADAAWMDAFWRLRPPRADTADAAFENYLRLLASFLRAGLADPAAVPHPGEDLPACIRALCEGRHDGLPLADADGGAARILFEAVDIRRVPGALDPDALFCFSRHEEGRLRLFPERGFAASDPLALCCRGDPALSLKDGLMLFAVILLRLLPQDDAVLRARVIRDLLAWADRRPDGPLRDTPLAEEDMPALVRDILLIVRGEDVVAALEACRAFDAAGRREEIARIRMLRALPADAFGKAVAGMLQRLEEHPLLCGRLGVFSRSGAGSGEDDGEACFDAGDILRLGAAFLRLFPDGADGPHGRAPAPSADLIRQALLASDGAAYVQHIGRGRRLFATPAPESWRELLAAGIGRDDFDDTRRAMRELLLEVAALDAGDGLAGALRGRIRRWLERRAVRPDFDWRRLCILHPAMQPSAAESGLMAWRRGCDDGGEVGGHELRLLKRARRGGDDADPHVRAALRLAAGMADGDRPGWAPEIPGVELRCVAGGWEIAVRPENIAACAVLEEFLAESGRAGVPRCYASTADALLLPVRQDAAGRDLEDRIAGIRPLLERLRAAAAEH